MAKTNKTLVSNMELDEILKYLSKSRIFIF